MRTIFLYLLVTLTGLSVSSSNAQDNLDIKLFNINNFHTAINNDTASCFLFWIPNCENAKKIYSDYVRINKLYGSYVKLYLIGLTNDPQKIRNIAIDFPLQKDLYIVDTLISSDILKRFEIFCGMVAKEYKIKLEDHRFSYFIIDKKNKILDAKLPGLFPEKLIKKVAKINGMKS